MPLIYSQIANFCGGYIPVKIIAKNDSFTPNKMLYAQNAIGFSAVYCRFYDGCF